ncbi:hypothetical protein EBH_0079410 [Eimeria brunetti]|uniref:Uncharacterized protein n=1 Tax=Eimeria brunetti TaxID=51314 RepID=U6LJ64_9EIME|nr:hypothetical protein EBH_0079410 [Eimeria brunetti]
MLGAVEKTGAEPVLAFYCSDFKRVNLGAADVERVVWGDAASADLATHFSTVRNTVAKPTKLDLRAKLNNVPQSLRSVACATSVRITVV